jgi:hypothetical protein
VQVPGQPYVGITRAWAVALANSKKGCLLPTLCPLQAPTPPARVSTSAQNFFYKRLHLVAASAGMMCAPILFAAQTFQTATQAN